MQQLKSEQFQKDKPLSDKERATFDEIEVGLLLSAPEPLQAPKSAPQAAVVQPPRIKQPVKTKRRSNKRWFMSGMLMAALVLAPLVYLVVNTTAAPTGTGTELVVPPQKAEQVNPQGKTKPGTGTVTDASDEVSSEPAARADPQVNPQTDPQTRPGSRTPTDTGNPPPAAGPGPVNPPQEEPEPQPRPEEPKGEDPQPPPSGGSGEGGISDEEVTDEGSDNSSEEEGTNPDGEGGTGDTEDVGGE